MSWHSLPESSRAQKYAGDLLPVIGLVLLGSLGFLNLLLLPPFEDEGTQLRRIWRVIEAGEWLQPLGVGKPLDTWLMVPFVSMGLHALTWIRGLNVLAGIIGAILVYRLALHLTDRKAALASGALFCLCPFVVYVERLAMPDIFLCAAGVWVLLTAIRFIGTPTWPIATSLAAALVVVAFCKIPVGFVFLMSMPLALGLMPTGGRRVVLQQPALTRLVVAYLPAILLVFVVAVTVVVQLRRGDWPGFGVRDLLGIGMGRYKGIAQIMEVAPPSLLGELTAQFSWTVVLIGSAGLVMSLFLGDWRHRWLIAMGAVPMVALATLCEFWYPRYLLPSLPPLLIAAVSGWRMLSLRYRRAGVPSALLALAVCLAITGYRSALIVFDPIAAKWSAIDRFQYIEGWGSGYGYPQAAAFLLARTDVPHMIYALDGHSAYQLRTYLPPQWTHRVRPISYGPAGQRLATAEARLQQLLSQRSWVVISDRLLQDYLVSSFGQENVPDLEVHRIAFFDKPGSRAQLVICQITRFSPGGERDSETRHPE
jgi:4-amino-4-deoxy-L-arabinose transferase-like glycosyltransferase